MTIQPLKKFLGLALLYVVVIFGIFAMQFRNESSVIYLTDKVKIIFTEMREAPLKSRIEITFPGVRIAVDERSPAFLRLEDKRIPLALESCKALSGRSAAFAFNNNTRVVLAADPETGLVTFSGELPANAQLTLPFQTAAGYSITEESSARAIVSSKDQTFLLRPGVTGQRELVISAENPLVSYSPHIITHKFAYENSLDSALADEAFYEDVVSGAADRLIELFGAGTDYDSEEVVVSYIAAMGGQNRYAQAVSSVPESFKSSRRRTYLSAPYFGSLAEMNASLTARDANLLAMMRSAAQRSSLDFFTVPGLADYLLRETDSQSVTAFLSMPAAAEGGQFEPSVLEAAGILNTYAALMSVPQSSAAASLSREYAGLLEPVLEACLDTIASACSPDGSVLTLYNGPVFEGAEPLELLQAADVGMALVNYGTVQNQNAVKHTGYYIINSLGNDVPRLGLDALGLLYPRFAGDSVYCPHSTVLASAQGRKIWAWSIARGIDYKTDSQGDVTVTIDFPAGNSHYLIIKGIAPFRGIEISGVQYRPDSRFESYNSSGYWYDERMQTLYIKSVPKTEQETVRIIYYAPPQRVVPAPAPVVAPPVISPVPIQEIPAGNVLQE